MPLKASFFRVGFEETHTDVQHLAQRGRSRLPRYSSWFNSTTFLPLFEYTARSFCKRGRTITILTRFVPHMEPNGSNGRCTG